MPLLRVLPVDTAEEDAPAGDSSLLWLSWSQVPTIVLFCCVTQSSHLVAATAMSTPKSTLTWHPQRPTSGCPRSTGGGQPAWRPPRGRPRRTRRGPKRRRRPPLDGGQQFCRLANLLHKVLPVARLHDRPRHVHIVAIDVKGKVRRRRRRAVIGHRGRFRADRRADGRWTPRTARRGERGRAPRRAQRFGRHRQRLRSAVGPAQHTRGGSVDMGSPGGGASRVSAAAVVAGNPRRVWRRTAPSASQTTRARPNRSLGQRAERGVRPAFKPLSGGEHARRFPRRAACKRPVYCLAGEAAGGLPAAEVSPRPRLPRGGIRGRRRCLRLLKRLVGPSRGSRMLPDMDGNSLWGPPT